MLEAPAQFLPPQCPSSICGGSYGVEPSGKVQDFLEESAIQQLPLLPGGADMNIIENMWGPLKRTPVKRNLQDSSKETLWAALSEELEKLRLDDQGGYVALFGLPGD
ncbi:hypothetical protein HPB47_020302 [Ixodes persulcatus]|uniref:Uncharacterized protein n=1 Tax=Ixodes persulcatus TaxID=34615 RepID=A0AC60QFU3_IXOPE|nr:hypothetical protein HPB47_020302 [Ixodes persulcatus]